MITQSIAIRHSVEMAHRLWYTPGRCQQIHGHNWRIELMLFGPVDDNGLLAGINFSEIKPAFRRYLDESYDHRLLLNIDDPWSGLLVHSFDHNIVSAKPETGKLGELPGLQTLPVDPTTENFARIIGEYALDNFTVSGLTEVHVRVDETDTNTAEWRWCV